MWKENFDGEYITEKVIAYERKKDERKSEKTRKNIEDAFIRLYAKRPIEKITMKNIADEAKTTRGTVYRYYEDIYDILETIEEKYFLLLGRNIDEIAKYLIEGKLSGECFEKYETYAENLEYLKVIFSYGKSSLPKRFEEETKKAIRKKLGVKEDNDEFEFILEYFVCGQIRSMIFWIKNDLRMPIETYERLQENLMCNGPSTVLKEYAKIKSNK